MRTRLLVIPAALAAVALAAGCGSGYNNQAAAPATTAASGSGGYGSGYGYGASSTPPATTAAVSTTSGALGTFLVGPDGRTLYLFKKDSGTTSACTGACATAWPPLTTTGAPTATGSAKSSLLGTAKREDGTTEVTYAGHPLYSFAGDAAPGDAKGQGLDHFGGEWYVLSPSGAAIEGSGHAS